MGGWFGDFNNSCAGEFGRNGERDVRGFQMKHRHDVGNKPQIDDGPFELMAVRKVRQLDGTESHTSGNKSVWKRRFEER